MESFQFTLIMMLGLTNCIDGASSRTSTKQQRSLVQPDRDASLSPRIAFAPVLQLPCAINARFILREFTEVLSWIDVQFKNFNTGAELHAERIASGLITFAVGNVLEHLL